jgi:hypothetical protein
MSVAVSRKGIVRRENGDGEEKKHRPTHRGTRSGAKNGQQGRLLFVGRHDVHRGHNQGSSPPVVALQDDQTLPFSSQEAGQRRRRRASGKKHLIDQRTNKKIDVGSSTPAKLKSPKSRRASEISESLLSCN